MLYTDLHQKTMLKLLRKKLMKQSGYKASGEDKYMVSSGKAAHKKKTLTAEL